MSKARAFTLPRLALGLAFGLNIAEWAWAYPSPSSALPRCLVEVEVQGDSDPVLLSTLREVVGRNQLVVRPPSSRGEPGGSTGACRLLARVNVALSENQVQVEVVDTVDGTLSTRRTLRRDPSSSIMREEVAIVVRSAIDALLERSHDEAKPPRETARAAPEPSPSAPPVNTKPEDSEPGTWALEGGVFGFGRTFAVETRLATGFGGLAAFTAGVGSLHPTVWLMGSYQLGTTSSRNGVDVQASGGSFRLIPTVSLYRGPSLVLDAGVGMGIDVLAVSTSSAVPAAHTHPDRTDVVPVGSLLVAARFPVGGGASLFVGGTGDLDFAPNRYVVARGEVAEPALELRALRLGGVLGFSHRLGGAGESR